MSEQPARCKATPPLIAIVGATATGKTVAGIALAQALNGEIVGADSRQVYRGMAIGTAQPSAAELAAVPHLLVGFLSPDEPFGLASYLDHARSAIAGIRERGRRPIIVGGTGQFVWALLEQWTVPRVPPDAELRADLEQFAAHNGADVLHARLSALDPEAAATIHPNNVRRVIRAIEVIEHTGASFSSQRQRQPIGDAIILGLSDQRASLYERIDRRVESMYACGLLDEVHDLARQGYTADLPAMASIGYPEAWAVIQGTMSIAEAVRLTQLATHRLVRQQSTWFTPGDARIRWLTAPTGPTAAWAAEVAAMIAA